jgi:plasmid stabilization system protein ParE
LTPIVKSQQFETDFASAALYLCALDPAVAFRFADAVEGAIDLLSGHPELGPIWRYGTPDRPTRYLLIPGFHNYLIFYRYEAGEVKLGRLLHGARDLGDVLGE